MLPGVVPRDPPEVRAAVPGKAEQPFVQVALNVRRRRLEGPVALVRKRRGPAVTDEDASEAGDDDQRNGHGESLPCPGCRLEAALDQCESDCQHGVGSREQEQDESEPVTVVDRTAVRRAGMCEARLTRGGPHGNCRYRTEHEQAREQLQASGIDCYGCEDAGRERDPRASPEGEIEGGKQENEGACASRTHDHPAGAAREGQGDQRAHSHEDRKAVPVPDRLS